MSPTYPLSKLSVVMAVVLSLEGVALSADAPAAETSPSVQNEAPAEMNAAAELDDYIGEHIGKPRIVTVAPDVYVAVGFDLANVVVIHTAEGNIVIDTGSCTPQAELIREQMAEFAPGPTRAIVYTQGAIEQLGGAGVWIGQDEVPIYGTVQLEEEFLRQLVVLQPAELRRGMRQFAMQVPDAERTATVWGRLPEASQLVGVPDIRLPNHAFEGETSVVIGGVELQLVAAPGESPDQLFVWLPATKTLLAGDNFVCGFPKICGLRGAPQRNADQWVASLDKMRALGAEHLVSAHHLPISGVDNVQAALTAHRDAIQWLRDETIRAINRGESASDFAARVKLPTHLEENPYLTQLTGSVAWAARTLYMSYAGWFDERPEAIQPVAPTIAARREVELMGGAEAVLAAASKARDEGDHAWSVHLLAKLQRAGVDAVEHEDANDKVDLALADSLTSLADETTETDAKAYLTSLAKELRTENEEREPWPCPSDDTLLQVPLEAFFRSMALGLKTEETQHLHETVYVIITDEERNFVLTIRHGVLEVVEETPLPGTPPARASITTDGLTWRKMCLGVANPTVEIVAGRATVKGSLQMVRRFSNYFDCPSEYERPQNTRRELTSVLPAKAIP